MPRLFPASETPIRHPYARLRDDPLLTAGEVARILTISLRTFQRRVSAGEFPEADLRSKRIVRWKSSTVSLWIESRTHQWRAAS